ncbi:MAG: hypothetical protein AB1521_09195 [Bacteroidota bacterium]
MKKYERKFERQELDDYKMFCNRDKDEEELDNLSLNRLKMLYEKYHANRLKKNLDDLFKKPSDLTSDK